MKFYKKTVKSKVEFTRKFSNKIQDYYATKFIFRWPYGEANAQIVITNISRFSNIFDLLNGIIFVGSLCVHKNVENIYENSEIL